MGMKFAINGFGRIGRNIIRAKIERGISSLELVAINDLASIENAAFLLEYDLSLIHISEPTRPY